MVLTAKDVSSELAPKVEEEKTLIVKLTPGKAPEITFMGFWTGKYITAAMNSIAKAYRVRRGKAIPPAVKMEAPLTPQTAVVKES
jgi:hypothetical protein